MKDFTREAVLFAGATVMLTIAGLIAVSIFRPDASATFIDMLTSASVALPLIVGVFFVGKKTLDKISEVNDKVSEVQGQVVEVQEKSAAIHKQVNGNLSRRDDEIERLTDVLAVNHIDPSTMTRREYRDQKGH